MTLWDVAKIAYGALMIYGLGHIVGSQSGKREGFYLGQLKAIEESKKH